MRKRLSYANVTATLALVFALSGGAMAANSYLITSTKQISPKVLTKLKGNTGKTGHSGSTGSIGSTGPAGPQGATGPAGSKGEPGVKGEIGTVDTANFYDKSETEERFAKGDATLMAARIKTALNVNDIPILEIPGVASVIELNCQSSGANAEISNPNFGSTDIWSSNPLNYAATNWAADNTPFEKTTETTFHVGIGTGSTSHIYTVNVTTEATGSECIFGVTALDE